MERLDEHSKHWSVYLATKNKLNKNHSSQNCSWGRNHRVGDGALMNAGPGGFSKWSWSLKIFPTNCFGDRSIFDFASFLHCRGRSTVLGINLSDKVFIYIAALQLLLSSGQRSVAAGLAGTIAGLLYHTGLFGLQKFTLPKFIEELFSATVGRALGGPLQRQQIFITPAPPQTTLGEGEFAGGSGPLPARPPTMPLSEPSPEAVQQLVEMGFPAESARQALQQANNNVELALQSLLWTRLIEKRNWIVLVSSIHLRPLGAC